MIYQPLSHHTVYLNYREGLRPKLPKKLTIRLRPKNPDKKYFHFFEKNACIPINFVVK